MGAQLSYPTAFGPYRLPGLQRGAGSPRRSAHTYGQTQRSTFLCYVFIVSRSVYVCRSFSRSLDTRVSRFFFVVFVIFISTRKWIESRLRKNLNHRTQTRFPTERDESSFDVLDGWGLRRTSKGGKWKTERVARDTRPTRKRPVLFEQKGRRMQRKDAEGLGKEGSRRQAEELRREQGKLRQQNRR